MITIIILITCGISFFGFTNRVFFEQYKFSPFKISRNKEYIRWLSGGFLHADPMHLMFNMLSLYFAGNAVEYIFGNSIGVAIFYLLAILVSGIPDFIQQKSNPYYSAVGASGGVSAALFSLLLFDPWGKVLVFFIIPMPFILFAILYVYYSYIMSKKNIDNIGHKAHLAGAIFGVIASVVVNPNVIFLFMSQLLNPPSLAEFFAR